MPVHYKPETAHENTNSLPTQHFILLCNEWILK